MGKEKVKSRQIGTPYLSWWILSLPWYKIIKRTLQKFCTSAFAVLQLIWPRFRGSGFNVLGWSTPGFHPKETGFNVLGWNTPGFHPKEKGLNKLHCELLVVLCYDPGPLTSSNEGDLHQSSFSRTISIQKLGTAGTTNHDRIRDVQCRGLRILLRADETPERDRCSIAIFP